MSSHPATATASGAAPEDSREQLIPIIEKLSGSQQRHEFLAANPLLLSADAVSWLKDVVLREVRVDPQHAVALAEMCLLIAERVGGDEILAHGLRSKANALYATGQHKEAIEHHRRAAELYRRAGNQEEVARTLSASIQPQLLLGAYDDALASAEAARKIFEAAGNTWRIARLDINLGNIYHRQDKFDQALACYERAYRAFLTHFDAEGTAAALSNIATCQITLNNFSGALESYQKARTFCERHGMPLLVGQADYNIAWLYYLRGDYGRAIEMLRRTREQCQENKDNYHFALCHMDLSEIYLDLNLAEEASETARQGEALFDQLGMGYERAKCLANLASAFGQTGQAFRAIELFSEAREMFVRERNEVWPALIDLYQALLLTNEGRLFEARRLCVAAIEFFDGSIFKGKALLAHLLMSRLHRKSVEIAPALRECSIAVEIADKNDLPKLAYEAQLQMGELLMESGRPAEARDSLLVAKQHLESLRGSMQNQELKIAFMENRLAVYEDLVQLCLQDGAPGASQQAFEYIEQSKSRVLMDLMSQSAPVIQAPSPSHSPLAQNIRELREELNWYYHRIEQEQLNREGRSDLRVLELQEELRRRENEFIRVLRELPTDQAERVAIVTPRTMSFEEIRAALPKDATLLEYFQIGEQIFAITADGSNLQILPVTLEPKIASLLRLLQFQLSKFEMGAAYVHRFRTQLLETTRAHLNELYEELVQPVREHLKKSDLIVVPHGLLHYVPFHALLDDEQYLGDKFQVCYSPSASIFSVCENRTANLSGTSLVLGVPDERAPHILDEARAVADILPQSELHIGGEATSETLRTAGEKARYIHIATHGFFRKDNPLFSGIRLSDAYVSLYDFYHLHLPAELVTLSGCATGISSVRGGDELLGLVRGLLQAGTKSLLVSFWNVNDQASTELMKLFYSKLASASNKAAALQAATRELRKEYPHPYYWAAFKLVGSPSSL